MTTKPTIKSLPARALTYATCEKFQIGQDQDGAIYFPYHDDKGQIVATKVRAPDKRFVIQGEAQRMGMFGAQLFPPGSAKTITITEGELDAASVFEMTGSRWPVVSVPNGAEGAAKAVAQNFEYLNSFQNIVVCFDKDEAKIHPVTGQKRWPGQEAAQTVASMFPIGKVRILTLHEHKDANDYLIAGKREQFNREWWAAPVFTPTGLKLGKSMWTEVSEDRKFETVSYPWQGLNDLTYGLRLSELVIITAETGIGKTSVIREIEYHIRKQKPDSGIGLIHLEESNADSALGLMSLEAGLPLHLPDVREGVTTDQLKGYFDAIMDTDKIVLWDHWGSNSIHEVLNKVRHMHNLGCKYIFLDHLSIVVSDQHGDERKQLDEISTKLKTLCMELNIAVVAVIHINRQGQIRGTAGVEQLANMVIRLKRNKLDEDKWRRGVTEIWVEKNRFCGKTGPACYVHYNEFTGRLTQLTDEQAAVFIQGGAAPVEVWV